MATGTDRMLSGGVGLSLARVVINLLQIGSNILIAWFLSPEDMGHFALAATVLAILNSISEMQLGQSLVRHRQGGEGAASLVWTVGLIRGGLLGLLCLLLAWPMALFFDDMRLIPTMAALSMVPVLLGFENPYRFLLQRDLNFAQDIRIMIAKRAFSVAAAVGAAICLENYWALVIGLVADAAASTLISYMLTRYRPRLTIAGFREVWNFSAWLMLGQVLNTVNWQAEFLVVGKFLGLARLGIYRMGSNLAQIPTAEMMDPIRRVVFPGFTMVMRDTGADPARIRAAYQRAQTFVTAVVLPVGVGFALVSDPLIRIVLDARWHDAGRITQYLAAIFAFQTLGSLVQPLAMAQDGTRRLFIRDLQMFLIRFPIILAGLYWWGLGGLVLARVVSGLLAVAVNMALVSRMIDLPVVRQLEANMRAFISVALMAAGCWTVARMFGAPADRVALGLQVAFEIVVGALVYVGANLVFWLRAGRPAGPETEMLQILGKATRKLRHAG